VRRVGSGRKPPSLSRDDLAAEVQASLFGLSQEVCATGHDDRLVSDVASGLMALVDRYYAARIYDDTNN